jgi:hypothetical protein
MQEEILIPANEFCRHHHIEMAFIHSLNEFGLIEISVTNEEVFIPNSQLGDLEKFFRLHHELNINLEGIDAINQLLERLETVQEEVNVLKNRLRFFDDSEL